MLHRMPIADLDAVLAMQVTVAWAGEGLCEPPRLGWWRTDVVDPDGGGDLMVRLMPRTHQWAAVEAAREAAQRVDARARARMASPDRVRTLFFLGFEVDEQVAERLAQLKREEATPGEALPLRLRLDKRLRDEELVAALQDDGADGRFEVVAGGREMQGEIPKNPAEIIARLGAGLVPLAQAYPMPFFRIVE